MSQGRQQTSLVSGMRSNVLSAPWQSPCMSHLPGNPGACWVSSPADQKCCRSSGVETGAAQPSHIVGWAEKDGKATGSPKQIHIKLFQWATLGHLSQTPFGKGWWGTGRKSSWNSWTFEGDMATKCMGCRASWADSKIDYRDSEIGLIYCIVLKKKSLKIIFNWGIWLSLTHKDMFYGTLRTINS